MEESRFRKVRDKLDAKTDGIEVHIEKHCWHKMFGWCRAANGEVSGLGIVKLEDSVFTVSEVYFPKQYGSGGYTELDDLHKGKLTARLGAKMNSKGQISDPGKAQYLKFWWHTHYNFNTFISGTDDNTAQSLMRDNGQFELNLVINQAGDFLAWLEMMSPLNLAVESLPVFLIPNSRKVKRKTNFASDIKRWAKPLAELPESQKPKPLVLTPKIMEPGGIERWFKEYVKKIEDEEPAKGSEDTKPRPLWHEKWLERKRRHEAMPDWVKNNSKTPRGCSCGDQSCTGVNGLLAGQKCKTCKGWCGKRIRGIGEFCRACSAKIEEESKQLKPVKEIFVNYGGTVIPQDVADRLKSGETEPEEAKTGIGCLCQHAGDWEQCICSRGCDVCIDKMVAMGVY